jgi:hypothetical protein
MKLFKIIKKNSKKVKVFGMKNNFKKTPKK